MADDRTEKATPKRRGEAKKKGQVAKSADLNSSAMLMISLLLIMFYSPSIMEKLKATAIYTFTHLDPNLITRDGFEGYFSPYINLTIEIMLPILLILMASGIIVNFVQIGPHFSMESLKPDFNKLNPATMITGLKKFFNLKSIVELLKSFVKLIIVGWIAYSVINSRKSEILTLLGADLTLALGTLTSIMSQMLMQIAIVYLILGIADKKYQAYEFEKSIKMTKEEVKDERKNAEGDPKIKSKIKGIQMQFAMQRMMTALPTADVVVTNPTHFAVAIRYDPEKAPAPQVVAKGVDYIAFKIKEVAANNNIPIIENKPLARTLYKIVPLEGLIPAELYVAVAEVLAYVYKINKGKIR